MDRRLIDYLPEYLREYKEERAIQEALQPEVGQIRELSGEMLQEAFILTEGSCGAGRWEKILKIHPKDTDSLQTRNLRILARINEVLPYTMTTLRRFLDSVLGAGMYDIHLEAEKYLLDIQIFLEHLGKVKEIRDYIEQITPVNLILLYTGKQIGNYNVDTQTEACFTARGDFYPRYNLAYLYLDDTWKMDSTYELSGYKSGKDVDFYPAFLGITTGIRAEPEIKEMLSVEKDLWYLDGTYALDGTKLLDAEIIKYEL